MVRESQADAAGDDHADVAVPDPVFAFERLLDARRFLLAVVDLQEDRLGRVPEPVGCSFIRKTRPP